MQGSSVPRALKSTNPQFLEKTVKSLPDYAAKLNRMEAESVSIGGMLTEPEELEAPPIEFDEKLWSTA